MKQKDKDLILRDLCCRLPYGVICHYQTVIPIAGKVKSYDKLRNISFLMDRPCFQFGSNRDIFDFDNIKPCLFPLSSMTEEQISQIGFWAFMKEYHKIVDFFYENHIDFRGLIEKGLVINANNLNIY